MRIALAAFLLLVVALPVRAEWATGGGTYSGSCVTPMRVSGSALETCYKTALLAAHSNCLVARSDSYGLSSAGAVVHTYSHCTGYDYPNGGGNCGYACANGYACASGYHETSVIGECVADCAATETQDASGHCLPVCPGGGSRNADGQCVCPGAHEDPAESCACAVGEWDGAKFVTYERIGGQCVPECGDGHSRDLVTHACVCTDATKEDWNGVCKTKCDASHTRDSVSGECTCPTGQAETAGTCYPPCGNGEGRDLVSRQCRCLPGYGRVDAHSCSTCGEPRVVNGAENCVCPGGTEDCNGHCLVLCSGEELRNVTSCSCYTPDCPAGQYRYLGLCKGCAAGRVWDAVKTLCVDGPSLCLPPKSMVDGTCQVATIDKDGCGVGYHLEPGKGCVLDIDPKAPVTTPDGKTWTPGGTYIGGQVAGGKTTSEDLHQKQDGQWKTIPKGSVVGGTVTGGDASCNTGFESVQGQCKEQCEAGKERVAGECKKVCGTGFTRNEQGTCQKDKAPVDPEKCDPTKTVCPGGDVAGAGFEGPKLTAPTLADSSGAYFSRLQSVPIVAAVSGIAASWPTGGGCCPFAGTVSLFGHDIGMGDMCGLWESIAGTLTLAALALWALLGARIVMSA